MNSRAAQPIWDISGVLCMADKLLAAISERDAKDRSEAFFDVYCAIGGNQNIIATPGEATQRALGLLWHRLMRLLPVVFPDQWSPGLTLEDITRPGVAGRAFQFVGGAGSAWQAAPRNAQERDALVTEFSDAVEGLRRVADAVDEPHALVVEGESGRGTPGRRPKNKRLAKFVNDLKNEGIAMPEIVRRYNRKRNVKNHTTETEARDAWRYYHGDKFKNRKN